MSVPGYASYRDTGVEWLGAVPSHWEVRRLKHIADAFPSNVDKKSYDDGTPVRLCNYTDVYYNDIIADDPDFMLATATADQVAKFTLRAGDTIITKDSETADDIASAAYVPSDLPGVVCGYHLSMIRPHPNVSGAFIKRYFDSAFAKASVHVRANGLTRVGLGQYAIDNLDLPLPPPPEQAAITAFLDRETGKIDALVEAQRRLIELLKEKRQAVISHAVTQGLDPAAPMKSSGVEWLGQVPEHWKVKPIKSIAQLAGRIGYRGYTTADIVDEGCGALALSPSNLRNGRVSTDRGTYVSWAKFEESPEIVVEATDVIIVKTGSTFGKVARFDTENVPPATINPQLLLIKNSSCGAGFMFMSLASLAVQGLISASNTGGTIPTITQEFVGNIKIAVPPQDEVGRIVREVSNTLKQIDKLSEEAEGAIALLHVRRTALISAAVTGKIDVRGLVTDQAKAA